MPSDFSSLESIFHMVQPADLLGAQRISLGGKAGGSLARELMDVLYGLHGRGAHRLVDLRAALDDMATKADEASLAQFRMLVHFYSTLGPSSRLSRSQNVALDSDGVEPVEQVPFERIVGSAGGELASNGKHMGVVTCNSGFLTPAVRNAERVELFLNFVPGPIASRLVPFLEVEFEFNRPADGAQPRFAAPGMLRFLLGSELDSGAGSATEAMLAARGTLSQDGRQGRVTAGMEMFTMPQSLVNPTPNQAGRYVDVLDPFRPFMSIENFSVNVSPTVGLYSYKKASLQLKLHDRSRMSEIADLVRPHVYQDALSAPTVWVTYGWRHPPEPGNPYADFVNANMLVREAYGVINSQFAFDNAGQVTITLSLWTRGIAELRTANIGHDGSIAVIAELRALARSINAHLVARGINLAEGANKEVRSAMVLEAAERGALPDMKKEEITKAINDLKTGLRSADPKVDAAAFESLRKELTDLEGKYRDFRRTVETQTSTIVAKQFAEVMIGADPFLPTEARDERAGREVGAPPHPLTARIAAYNRGLGRVSAKDQRNIIDPRAPGGFRRKLVSLGKLVSVFFAGTFKHVDAFDELQLFFYQLNDAAGDAAGTNLAGFPIEMNVFLDQYREHVERKGSERVTLEEFLQLVFDAQVNDPRALAYGFRDFYAPYDPASKHDAKLAKGRTPEQLLAATAKFQAPAPAVYVETTFAAAAPDGAALPIDILAQSEAATAGQGGRYTRIMRVHVFDKANNPYKLPEKLLSGDDDATFNLAVDEARRSDAARASTVDVAAQVNDVWRRLITNVQPDGRLDPNALGCISNDEIKRFVSKMVPTIVYGGNASTVAGANLASKQDPLLATAQMQSMTRKSGRPSVTAPNGTDAGGLPMRVVPASMTMTTLGCPLLTYAQIFFIDFGSGTTVDNLYNLTGIQHTISPGKFESQLTLTFADAYGQFFGTHQRIVDYFVNLRPE